MVEAWPGSVTTEQYEMPDGTVNRFLDGVATRILERIPDDLIAVGLWVVPLEQVPEFRSPPCVQ